MNFNNMKKQSILITGAGGFVGKSFIEYLIQKKKYSIIAIEVNPNKCKILQSLSKDIIVYNDSTTNESLLINIFKSYKIDYIYHTAAIVEEYGSMDDFYKINVEATLRLADLAIKNKVKAFIHLSSVMVYGFDYPFMVKEEESELLKDKVLKTQNPYCVTKIIGEEKLLELYNQHKNFNLVIIRPGDIIGIESQPWIVRPIFLRKHLLFALPNHGSGILNLLYIENLNKTIYKIIERMPDQKIKGEIFNLRDEYITVKEFYRYLFEKLDLNQIKLFSLNASIMKFLIAIVFLIQKIFKKKPWAHPEGVKFLLRNNPVSNEKSIRILGYKTNIQFYQEMDKIISYFKNQSS